MSGKADVGKGRDLIEVHRDTGYKIYKETSDEGMVYRVVGIDATPGAFITLASARSYCDAMYRSF